MAEKYRQLFEQSEVEYTTVASGNERCANCRFFAEYDEYEKCAIVLGGDPYPIVSEGWCTEWRAYPIRDDHYNIVGEVDNPAEPFPNPVDIEDKLSSMTGSLSQNIKRLLRNLGFLPDLEAGGFKMLDNDRFLAWWSNNFKDKEDEIISEFALKNFVEQCNAGLEPMPELWFNHTEGTDHGQATKLFMIGHFAVALGTFASEESNPLVADMKSWYAKQKKITMSHQFFYKANMKRDGVYYHIRTFEISSLKHGKEANAYTAFEQR